MKHSVRLTITYKHYLKMNNEQEIWKQIPMFPTYAASNLGRIKSIKKDRVLKQEKNDKLRDYQKVSISYKNKSYTKKVARLIWAAFKGGECPETINHIDGNPKNNNIKNLECISNRENCRKKHIYTKTINKYDLTDDKKRQIQEEYLQGSTPYSLSLKYNIPSNYLYTTFKRGSWKHLCWKDDTENTSN